MEKNIILLTTFFFLLTSGISFASITAVISSDPTPTDTLQTVTDRGASTTNTIDLYSDLNVDNSVKINAERNNLNDDYLTVWGPYLPTVPRNELIQVSDYGVTLLQSDDIKDLSKERGVQMGTSLSLWTNRPTMFYNHVTPKSKGGVVWQLLQSNIYNTDKDINIKVAEIGILAGNSPNAGYLYLGANTNINYIRNAMRISDERTIEVNPSQITSALGEDAWLQVFGSEGGKDYFAVTSQITAASNDNQGDIFIVKENGNVGIGEQSPTYPLEVGSNVSGISAWFETDVSATGYITRTYQTDLTDEQAYNLVQYALNNEYDAKGNYNYQAWGECYAPHDVNDKTKPIYTNITKTEYIGEEDDLEEVVFTYEVITEYETETIGGVNIDCKQVMISKSQNHLTKEFNGDVAFFNQIYTKSKVPRPDVDYASDFKIQELNKKSTHYATTKINGQEVLDMEERIVRLEGAMAQMVSESCLYNKRYSWCKR